MRTNRRDFFKLMGLSGLGLILSEKLTGKERYQGENIPEPKALKNIYREAGKKHQQRFNMCGYAAPAIDNVRIGFVGVEIGRAHV